MGGYVDFKFSRTEGLPDGGLRFMARIYEGDYVLPRADEIALGAVPAVPIYRREKCLREVTCELGPGSTIEDARAYMNARLAFMVGKRRLPSQTSGDPLCDPSSAKQPVPTKVEVRNVSVIGA